MTDRPALLSFRSVRDDEALGRWELVDGKDGFACWTFDGGDGHVGWACWRADGGVGENGTAMSLDAAELAAKRATVRLYLATIAPQALPSLEGSRPC